MEPVNEPFGNTEKLDTQQINDIWHKADRARGNEARLSSDVFDLIRSHEALLEEQTEERAMYKRNFAVIADQLQTLREVFEREKSEWLEVMQSIQQERDKLLKKMEYKDLIISNAVELIEDREKVLSEVRPFVSPDHQKLIDEVVDNGSFNVGVGEERT